MSLNFLLLPYQPLRVYPPNKLHKIKILFYKAYWHLTECLSDSDPAVRQQLNRADNAGIIQFPVKFKLNMIISD